jgi:hypothetical protein
MSEISIRPGEAAQHPRPRIQSLSDLIFGLALSIGALNLITSKPADTQELFGSIAHLRLQLPHLDLRLVPLHRNHVSPPC